MCLKNDHLLYIIRNTECDNKLHAISVLNLSYGSISVALISSYHWTIIYYYAIGYSKIGTSGPPPTPGK